MKILINTIIGIVFYSVFSLSVSASALQNIPDQKYWSLATDDIVKYNTVTKTANAEVYFSSVDGTLVRGIATTTSSRIMSLAKVAKGLGYIGAAVTAAELMYDGYQWLIRKKISDTVDVGTCSANNKTNLTVSECEAACIAAVKSVKPDSQSVSPSSYDTITRTYTFTDFVTIVEGSTIYVGYTMNYFISHSKTGIATESGSTVYPRQFNFQWHKTGTRDGYKDVYQPISDEEAEALIMPQLVNVSSRDAFADGSMPYPMAGLFTAEDVAIDPTYSPQANITTQNLNDYITKYNNGLLQSTDPSAANYVTPAQYAYIKAQAEQAAATAANPNSNTSGATSTNPLADMEQPITQAQYDESNKKYATEQAAALNTAFAPLTATMTQFNADKQEMIGKIGSPTSPPADMPNIFNWVWPTGICNGFTVNLNIHVPVIGSLTLNKKFDEYCVPYQEYIHPAFFWFFNLITALYIFRLWDRTAVDVAKI